MFKRSEFFRFFVEILQSDDFVVVDVAVRIPLFAQRVNKVNASGIRGVTIGDKSDLLFRGSGANGFVHGGDSRLNTSIISDMGSISKSPVSDLYYKQLG